MIPIANADDNRRSLPNARLVFGRARVCPSGGGSGRAVEPVLAFLAE